MSRGHSGTTSFVYDIERYKNKETGEMMTPNEAEEEAKDHPFGDAWFDMNYEYQVIKLEIEGSSYYQPGRSHGLPENCYPDEGETEITSAIGPDKKDWTNNLTDAESDSIIEKISEEVVDGFNEPDEDDYYDADE